MVAKGEKPAEIVFTPDKNRMTRQQTGGNSYPALDKRGQTAYSKDKKALPVNGQRKYWWFLI